MKNYHCIEKVSFKQVLAAELGKALLVKNEELNTENERMADEFSQRLEVRKVTVLDCVCISTRSV